MCSDGRQEAAPEAHDTSHIRVRSLWLQCEERTVRGMRKSRGCHSCPVKDLGV